MLRLAMKERLLTEVELEIMTLLWRLERATVHDVLAALPRARALAYTSVSTVIRILEQKGFVKSVREGKHHLYSPRVTKARYEQHTLGHIVERVFEGDGAALVRRLVDSGSLEKAEIESLRDLLDERLKR